MKNIFIIMTALMIAMCGCKSHKNQASNNTMQPKFEENVEWQLVTIRGKRVEYKEDQRHVTISFNPEANNVSGCSGCNRYFGTYEANISKGLLSLGEMNSTKMACPEPFMKLERQYLSALQKVDRYDMGEYELKLYQGATEVLGFEKVQKEAE
ncbi:MAG: META domain-containing protein [Bacteroidales bacterium]|nr:META domain-containing protein [Bacteroidales bacterium]